MWLRPILAITTDDCTFHMRNGFVSQFVPRHGYADHSYDHARVACHTDDLEFRLSIVNLNCDLIGGPRVFLAIRPPRLMLTV
jgi:hypothetical protein